MSITPLSRAATLPSRFYLDPGLLEEEKERVFGASWQLVARAEELQRVGDFVPVTVLNERPTTPGSTRTQMALAAAPLGCVSHVPTTHRSTTGRRGDLGCCCTTKGGNHRTFALL